MAGTRCSDLAVVYCVPTFPGSPRDFVAAIRFPSVPTPSKEVYDPIIELKRFFLDFNPHSSDEKSQNSFIILRIVLSKTEIL